jgi:ATP-dependent RNA helicase RhlE
LKENSLTQFDHLGLISPLLKALAEEGYDRPTPIQAQAIPHILEGRDIVGAAQTGTGKTAAFALPLLQKLTEKPLKTAPRAIRALILAPTRELASQIEEAVRAYGRHLKITSTTAFGGVPIGRQRRAVLNGLDILVATPGRLLDLVDSRDLDLSKVEFLVLDEADRMLDLGFIHALRRISGLLPKDRQSLFFSATMPPPIRELAGRFLKANPAEVAVAPVASAAETVDQKVVMVRGDRKPALLAQLLAEPGLDRVIVFTRTKHGADRVVRQMAGVGIQSAAIHGNKSQNQREKALEEFRDGTTPVLIATDIAARGIDVDGVNLVVNYELPNIPETYVHRIGRTGRAGATGRAVAFCAPDEAAFLRDIERLMKKRIFQEQEPVGLTVLSAGRAAPEHQDPRRDNNRGGQRGGPGGGQRDNGPRGGRSGAPQSGGNRRDDRPARSEDRPARTEQRFEDRTARAPQDRNDRPRSDATPRSARPFADRGTERHAPANPQSTRRQSDSPVSFGHLVEMIGHDAKATGRDDLRSERPASRRPR